ncbi:MAG: hypothetical protein HOJ85_06135 [Ilumatobacter sp.]|jgi:hypothetical protein|uniref:hypothetical protein n=1 Tax=Ilumatobacter sp. TaxID=1967498 RepID=UPI001D1F27F5|nr:hypothetical protein [Ilumatobacter sp.]MBT5275676.1 hypothetical protein [Ilumatobacter sp.]MBT5553324.1 hypothetical protein [Ilumatobacter sp.]MBT5866031.1 hypothetical protein [Ilumatobacter sp.]MDG0977319.1 hypothetical protein [Ilumatobacter sp.]
MFRKLMVAGCSLLLGACATTVNEPDAETPSTVDVTDVPEGAEPALESGELIDGGVIVDGDAPSTTIALTGSATDLLPEMSIEMSRLGSQVAEGGDDNATLARIEQIWERIRPEIERDRPELLNGLGATIVMARTAVERTRPADADKAFSLLTDLVDQFTGDG